jgi:acylglycerol lipase
MNNHKIDTIYGKINIIEGVNIKNIKSIILWVHGFGGHFQYVDDTLDELINKDFFFSNFDLKSIAFEFIGHGNSDGEKFLINDIDIMVNIMKIVIQFIKHKYKNINIFICAESMGCAITLKYLTLCNTENNIQDYKSIIFLSPMCGIDESNIPNCFIINLLKCISYIFPSCTTPCLEINENTTSNNKYNIKRKNSIYTFNNIYKLATSRELYNLNEWIKDNIDKIQKLKNNFLIFQGKLDTICNYNNTINVFKNNENKEIILFENKSHILLVKNDYLDTIPDMIYIKILNFINEKLSSIAE